MIIELLKSILLSIKGNKNNSYGFCGGIIVLETYILLQSSPSGFHPEKLIGNMFKCSTLKKRMKKR